MALDQTQNLVKVQVSGTHSDTDTTIQLGSGEASNCPDPASGEYNMVWWDINTAPDPADDPNAEIVRVTGRDTGNDTLTVTRGQENTSASTKNNADSDYKLILGITSKMIDDIEARDLQDISSITTDEETQLTNIDSVTITNTQWGYLGGMSGQPLEDIVGESITDLSEINTATATAGNVLRADGTDFESTQLNHTDLTSISSDDHHTKYALTEDLASGEITQIQNIDSNTITNTQWGYLGALDQSVTSSSNVAFGNVDLSGYLDVGVFTDGNEPTASQGRIFYSDEQEALSFYDGNGNEINLGQDVTIKAKNVQGTTINKGDAVYISGSSGNNPEVQYAQADSLSTSRLIGIVVDDSIANNGVGKVALAGRVIGFDTSSFTAGDTLWLSPDTAGGITNTEPTSPDFKFRVGTVINSNATDGSMIVDVDREIDLDATEIAELQNIDSVTITNTQWGYLGSMSAQPLEDITGEPIGDLSNVSLSSPSSDEVLTYNGTNWVNQAAGGGSNFDAHEFTSSETWSAVSGLSSDTLVQTIIDIDSISSGSLSVEVDSTEEASYFSAGQHTYIYKPSSSLDVISKDEGYSLSTASYDSVNKDVSSEDGIPRGIDFKPDGTKMYIL
ncbi:MAG TPA: hypothetical protein VJ907_04660, partial [Halanaerobiales bacterium]|nr:hypothetical protein [Halanaerobiales bacterium]